MLGFSILFGFLGLNVLKVLIRRCYVFVAARDSCTGMSDGSEFKPGTIDWRREQEKAQRLTDLSASLILLDERALLLNCQEGTNDYTSRRNKPYTFL